MTTSIRSLEPKSLWNFFADISAIPRASKKEQRITAFVRAFGERLGLDTLVDQVGNVVIKKPASPGMENRPTVILQSHLDMVHQKNADTVFDFDTEGIRTFVDGDWVRAEGTTLGADNGLGVTAIMAILASESVQHPPLEALFTIDEETGMTGAHELRGDLLSGTVLLNLDSEIDDEVTIGCAGGLNTTATLSYTEEDVPVDSVAYRVSVKGLKGGHSGMDIHLGRGNANKMLVRLLTGLAKDMSVRISSVEAGGLRNAIPREAVADFTVSPLEKERLVASFNKYRQHISTEYRVLEPELHIELTPIHIPIKVMPVQLQSKVIAALYAVPNGVFRMAPDIPDLVETSSNLAQVQIADGKIALLTMQRSSSESGKEDIANAVRSAFELIGAEVRQDGDYPGWAPRSDSPILQTVVETYQKLFSEKPKILACHAGLECGILGQHYPGLDMVSFGPNIRGAHSPDECAQISSVQKFWKLLLAVLANIPAH